MNTIVGIGLDLIEIAHFQINYDLCDEDLLHRCFTSKEIEDSRDSAVPVNSFAARLAAKEAAFKALCGGIGIAHTEIETRRSITGLPQLLVYGQAKVIADQQGVSRFLVSLSHSASAAAAVVIALSDDSK